MDIKTTTPEIVAVDLEEWFAATAEANGQHTSVGYDKICATKAANVARDSHPMYIGELNPNWKFWDDVITAINKDETQEQ